MKKILSLTMALTMLGTALTGCGSKDAATKTPAENTRQEQSQTEKALALINTFATGDTDTARSLLADGYIQHNLAYGTGADAFIGSVEYLASADLKTTVKIISAFAPLKGSKIISTPRPAPAMPSSSAPHQTEKPKWRASVEIWIENTLARMI